MRIHEDFTRCECGNAYFKKEIFVLASYQKDSAQQSNTSFQELLEHSEIRYTCANCHALIYTKRE